MLYTMNEDIMEKLKILSDAAKYDVACTSSGVDRAGDGKSLGNAAAEYAIRLQQMAGVYRF